MNDTQPKRDPLRGVDDPYESDRGRTELDAIEADPPHILTDDELEDLANGDLD